MAHPKAMYQMTDSGLVEKVANNFEEEWSLAKSGWYPHPEEARLVKPVKEVESPKPERKTIDEMDRKELEAYARTLGVELDGRKSKANMMKDLEDALK